MSAIMTLAILGVVLSVGGDIVATLRDDYSGVYAYSATNTANTQMANNGLDSIASWQSTIGLVLVGMVVITVITFGFGSMKVEGGSDVEEEMEEEAREEKPRGECDGCGARDYEKNRETGVWECVYCGKDAE